MNQGNRSALKRVTEKDSVSRREMVLCISAVGDLGQAGSQAVAKIEVTDGW